MASTGKPSGTFRDDARWVDARLAVEFTLDFRDDEGVRVISCSVSRAALDDAARRSGPIDAAVALRLFRSFKGKIESVVERKLSLAQFEEDGFIRVRTADLNG